MVLRVLLIARFTIFTGRPGVCLVFRFNLTHDSRSYCLLFSCEDIYSFWRIMQTGNSPYTTSLIKYMLWNPFLLYSLRILVGVIYKIYTPMQCWIVYMRLLKIIWEKWRKKYFRQKMHPWKVFLHFLSNYFLFLHIYWVNCITWKSRCLFFSFSFLYTRLMLRIYFKKQTDGIL